jgi:hypothetical protein
MNNIDGTGNDGAEIDIFESAWTQGFCNSYRRVRSKQAS